MADTWREKKRKYKITDDGSKIPMEVTEELVTENTPLKWERKDIVDIVFRSIGVLTIAIPIFIFVNQRKAEIQRQREVYQLEIYTTTSVELHKLANVESSVNQKQLSFDKIFYEIYPKLLLLNNLKILNLIDTLKQEMIVQEMFSTMYYQCKQLDTILSLVYYQTSLFLNPNYRKIPFVLLDSGKVAMIRQILNDVRFANIDFSSKRIDLQNSALVRYHQLLQLFRDRLYNAESNLHRYLDGRITKKFQIKPNAYLDSAVLDMVSLPTSITEFQNEYLTYHISHVSTMITEVDQEIRKSSKLLSIK